MSNRSNKNDSPCNYAIKKTVQTCSEIQTTRTPILTSKSISTTSHTSICISIQFMFTHPIEQNNLIHKTSSQIFSVASIQGFKLQLQSQSWLLKFQANVANTATKPSRTTNHSYGSQIQSHCSFINSMQILRHMQLPVQRTYQNVIPYKNFQSFWDILPSCMNDRDFLPCHYPQVTMKFFFMRARSSTSRRVDVDSWSWLI